MVFVVGALWPAIRSLWQVIDGISTLDFIRSNAPTVGAAIVTFVSSAWGTWLPMLAGVGGVAYLLTRSEQPSNESLTEVQAITGLARLGPLPARTYRPGLRRDALALADELHRFAVAQRAGPSTLGEMIFAQTKTFDPTPRATEAYALQYKSRVAALYREGDWRSNFRLNFESEKDFLSTLKAEHPPMPATINEIVGIAREIESFAKDLPDA